MSHLFVDTFYVFGVVENFVYSARITAILTSYLFGCMSLGDDLFMTSRFVRHLEMYKYRSLYSCLVILPFSVSLTFNNVTSVKFISLLLRRTMLVVAKPVTWTLDPNRPHKPEVDIMIYSVASEAHGVCYNVTKIAVSFHCLLCDFRQKPHCGVTSVMLTRTWASRPRPRTRIPRPRPRPRT